jgi:peptidoglycan/xylan/chitin deacetylase (PgdA/CDA1 family)
MMLRKKKQSLLRLLNWGLLSMLSALLLTSCASDTLRRETPLRRDWGTKVPVIMYHRIVPDAFWTTVAESQRPDHFRIAGIGNGSDPYLYLRSQSDFEQDISHLARNGYSPISLYELREYILSRNPAILPKKPVVLTFDDGSSDWFDIAYPILSKYDFKATFFVVTSDDARAKFSIDTGPLSWQQMRQMALHKNSSGKMLFDFESHTHNHANLSAIALVNGSDAKDDLSALRRELQESMAILRERIGREPKFLALPYGAGGQNFLPHTRAFPIIRSVAQELGYLGIRTSRDDIANDLTTDIYKIGSQIIVFSSTTSQEFSEKLNSFSIGEP